MVATTEDSKEGPATFAEKGLRCEGNRKIFRLRFWILVEVEKSRCIKFTDCIFEFLLRQSKIQNLS